jgi:hypothetical protein
MIIVSMEIKVLLIRVAMAMEQRQRGTEAFDQPTDGES